MNLIEMIKEEFNGTVRSSISQKTGASEDQVDKGLSVAIPSVLGGILKNSGGNNENFLSGLLNITGDANLVDNPDEADDSQLLEKGSALTNNLFGSDRETITNEISNATGLDQGKSSGLLAMIVPAVTGLISKLMTKHNWNFSDLVGRIGSLGLTNIPGGNSIKDNIPEADLPPIDFPKTDTPPEEQRETEASQPEIPEPEIPQSKNPTVQEEQYSAEDANIEVPPAPIPPVVDEPSIVESEEARIEEKARIEEDTPIDETPVTESQINEPVIEKPPFEEPKIEEPRIAEPRSEVPPVNKPEPEVKSGGMLRWVLIIVLIILLLWWLL